MGITFELVGNSAIVTGAGQGIGYDIAGHLMAAAANVLIYEIDPDRAHAAAERLTREHPSPRALAFAGDVTDEVAMRAAFELATESFGSPRILVNNALYQYPDLIVRVPVAYCSAKAAVSQFTTVAALEYASMGIRVNAIAPGLVNTELSAGFLGESPEVPAAFVRNTPLGRVGETADQAQVAVFLASTAAAWVAGVTLLVDGGLHLLGVPDNWELFRGPLGKTGPTPADWLT